MARQYYPRSRKELYQAIGLGEHINPRLETTFVDIVIGKRIDGSEVRTKKITVYAKVQVDTSTRRMTIGGDVDSRRHRVFALCPHCEMNLPLSRLPQHYLTKVCRQVQGVQELRRLEAMAAMAA